VVGTDIIKTFRLWKYNSLRDATAIPVTTYFSSKPVLNDSHMFLELSFVNSSNKRFELNEVTSVYSPSAPY